MVKITQPSEYIAAKQHLLDLEAQLERMKSPPRLWIYDPLVAAKYQNEIDALRLKIAEWEKPVG